MMFKNLRKRIKFYVAMSKVKTAQENLYGYNHVASCRDPSRHPKVCCLHKGEFGIQNNIAWLSSREIDRMLFNIDKDRRLKGNIWEYIHRKLSLYQELVRGADGDNTVLSSRLRKMLTALYYLKTTLTIQV